MAFIRANNHTFEMNIARSDSRRCMIICRNGLKFEMLRVCAAHEFCRPFAFDFYLKLEDCFTQEVILEKSYHSNYKIDGAPAFYILIDISNYNIPDHVHYITIYFDLLKC